jgi:hypothetical protein
MKAPNLETICAIYFIALIIAFFCCCFAIGWIARGREVARQQHKIDSLEKVIPTRYFIKLN